MGNYLGKNSRSLRRRERRPSCTHTAAPVLGPRAVTLGGGGEYRPVGRRVFYCQLCSADGSSPWSYGALSSSPVHRALVLVLGTNIAVLLDCSKSSRQCSLPSFLTYLCSLSLTTGRRRPSFRSPPPQGWGYRQPDSRCIARCGRRLVTAGHAAGSTLLSAVEACGRHGPYLRPAVCGRARRPPCAQGSLVSSSSRSKGSPGPRRQRQRSPPVPGDAKS